MDGIQSSEFILTTSQTTTQSIHSLTSRYSTAHNATSLLNQSRLSHIASGEDYIGYNENNSLNHLLIEAHNSPQLRYWAFVLVLFPLMTIIGNILVVISVFREKYLQTCTNFFVVSLALSDLIVASCVMPLAVYYEITQKWHFTNFMCDLWVSMDVMGSTASILNLVSIAIDRYIAVKYPIKYAQHKSSNRIYLTIAFVWILSIMIALPMLLGMNETKNRNPDECAFNNDTFLLYSSVFSFYLPTLLMIMLYYKIFRKIRSRAKLQSQKLVPVKKDKAQDKIKNASEKNINNENDELINKNNGEGGKQKIKETHISIKKSTKSLNPMNIMSSASKKEKRITKTLAIVLIVYLVCWSPFFAINNLAVGICHKMGVECKFITNPWVTSFLTWLGYLNSLLNPIIYTTFNPDFRRAFATIFSDVSKLGRN